MNELQARRDVAAYCTLLWQRRLTTGTSGNVSVRLNDGDIIVTPASVSLRALFESELVLVDRSGAPRVAGQRATSELPLHLAAYDASPAIRAVIHTHPTYCVVWGKQFASVFPQDTVGASETLGRVAWTQFRPAGSPELAQLCSAEFAKGVPTVLMERHGLSTAGATLEEAFVLADLAEEAARVAFLSRMAVGS